MPTLGVRISPYSTIAAALLLIFALLCATQTATSQGDQKPSQNGNQNDTSFQLKVQSNLVLVRVVVRDAQGKPVENLKKEDFKIFDQGKEQTITQFDVENSAPPTSNSAWVSASGQSVLSPPSAMPGKSIALYFDDLNTSDADIVQTREAADHYLSANLQPQDRVAIFTSSEQLLSDFTSDPKRIHDALVKLHTSERNLTRTHYCPDLSDFQALQITQNNAEALAVATDEVKHCEGGVLMPPGGASGGAPLEARSAGGIADAVIRNLAQNIVNESQIQARINLQQLEQVVNYIAQKPGQRTVILVSPGFLAQSEQYQLDRIIDRALRSQVVISALDPKGLAILMREVDTTRGYIPATNPSVLNAAHRVDSERELVATAVLAEVADGTGGEFFHNSNDLKGGFGALAGSPAYYILGFAPGDLKPDGKFHALKVTLAEKEKGFHIQARRGYFSSKNKTEAAATLPEAPSAARVADAKASDSNPAEPPDPATQVQEKIRESVLSKTEVQELPVALDVRVPPGQGETRELSLSAHLDATSLHFRKEGDHNINTVIFIFAVFDQNDTLVNAQQRRARVNVADAELPGLLKSGINVNLTFQLKPGMYRVREVVTDSEDQRMTTLSREVTIP